MYTPARLFTGLWITRHAGVRAWAEPGRLWWKEKDEKSDDSDEGSASDSDGNNPAGKESIDIDDEPDSSSEYADGKYRPGLRRGGGRPIAEPPIFNYERFEKEFRPSDKMLKKTFPSNPAKAAAYRDVLTEKELLDMFEEWAEGVSASNPSKLFSFGLHHELALDFMSVWEEHDQFRSILIDLEKWETKYLDIDGNLEGVREKTGDGEDIFTNHPDGGEATLLFTHRRWIIYHA